MPKYQPFATYPDDINAVVCTVWETNLGNYTSNFEKITKELSIRAAEEFEARGIKAYYSRPYGLGAGGILGYPIHQLLIDIRNAFTGVSILQGVRTVVRFLNSFRMQLLSNKVDVNKGSLQLILNIHTKRGLVEYDRRNLGRRLMQLNLFAMNIIKKFQRDMSDYKFSANIVIRLDHHKFTMSFDSIQNKSYQTRLNHWLADYGLENGVDITINKKLFNRLRIAKRKYTDYPSRTLSKKEAEKLTYETDGR